MEQSESYQYRNSQVQGETELLRARDLAAVLNMGESSVWRHVKNGDIPKPIKIGGSTRWRRADIEAIISPATE